MQSFDDCGRPEAEDQGGSVFVHVPDGAVRAEPSRVARRFVEAHAFEESAPNQPVEDLVNREASRIN